MPLLKVHEIHKSFPVSGNFLSKQKKLSVINGVSFQIKEGEILGIVGESGCGKSTLARLIMRIYEATHGSIEYQSKELSSFSAKEYYQQVQMVFQDPFSSLNPKMRVRSLVGEMLRLHHPHQDTEKELLKLLEEVGLPASSAQNYPHEFSGGQRQRIAIARALAARPQLLIADEPVSALDVSIQAQILNLLQELQQRYQLSLLFISHDLSVVANFCHRVLVMYLGTVVEVLRGDQLYTHAKHPYTKALLNSIPSFKKRKEGIPLITGEPPSLLEPLKSCPFYSRCSQRRDQCLESIPALKAISEHHEVACPFAP